MNNNPRRFFFLLFALSLIFSWGIEFGRKAILFDYIVPVGQGIVLPEEKELLIERSLERGNVDEAIPIYEETLEKIAADELEAAKREFGQLVEYGQSTSGQLINFLAGITWRLPFLLLSSAGLFFIVWLAAVIISWVRPKPLFLLLPFQDLAGTGLGDHLPALCSAQIRAFDWSSRALEEVNDFLVDNLELPAMGFLNDEKVIDTSFLLETAFSISTGISNTVINKAFKSIKLWFEQPEFFIRGILNKYDEDLIVEIHLINSKSHAIEKIWYAEVNKEDWHDNGSIVSEIVYVVLHHFSSQAATKNWKAFKYLNLGVRELNYYGESTFDFSHLVKAKEYFKKAVRIDASYRIAKYNLGLTNLLLGEFQRAKENFKDLIQSSDESLSLKAKYNYGVALFSISQDWAYQYSIKIFQELIEEISSQDSDFIFLTKATLAMVYGKLVNRNKKFFQKYSQDAIDLIEDILLKSESDQSLSYAKTAAGWVYLASKDLDAAEISFNEAIQLDSTQLQAYLGIGEVYEKQERVDDGIKIFREASNLFPFSEYVYYRLGLLYYRKQDEHEGAIEALLQAPRFPQAKILLGKVYLDEGRLTQALQEFRTAVQISSKLAEGWVNIAWTILQIGDISLLKEAELAARRALQLEPEKSSRKWHRHAILAKCLFENNDLKKAYQEALLAVELGKKYPQGYLYLAEIQAALGYKEEARRNLQTVFDLDKNKVWLSDAKILFTFLDTSL